MTGRPKLLRLKKRTIVSSYNLKLTIKPRKFRSETIGGLVLLSFRNSCQTTLIMCVEKNTNKTQVLHRIRLKKFVPNTPLHENYSGEKLQPDEKIVIPQDNLYTISWEVNFDYELFETRKDNWPDTTIRLPNDATSGEVDNYVTTEDESSSVKESQRSSERSNDNDVGKNEIKLRPASSRDATSTINE